MTRYGGKLTDYLAQLDYAQLELRVMAEIAKEADAMNFKPFPVPELNGKKLVQSMWVADVGGFRFIITLNENGYVSSYSDGTIQQNGLRSRDIAACQRYTTAVEMCKAKYKHLKAGAH